MEPIDWTTTDGCARCWEHGPFLPYAIVGLTDEDRRDVHQAWHDICVEVLRPVVRLIDTLDRWLARWRLVD